MYILLTNGFEARAPGGTKKGWERSALELKRKSVYPSRLLENTFRSCERRKT